VLQHYSCPSCKIPLDQVVRACRLPPGLVGWVLAPICPLAALQSNNNGPSPSVVAVLIQVNALPCTKGKPPSSDREVKAWAHQGALCQHAAKQENAGQHVKCQAPQKKSGRGEEGGYQGFALSPGHPMLSNKP